MLPDCIICLEPFSGSDIQRSGLRITKKCTHSRHICGSCLEAHIESNLELGNARIFCPEIGCKQELTEDDVQEWGEDDEVTL
jgi:hypothetical protein